MSGAPLSPACLTRRHCRHRPISSSFRVKEGFGNPSSARPGGDDRRTRKTTWGSGRRRIARNAWRGRTNRPSPETSTAGSRLRMRHSTTAVFSPSLGPEDQEEATPKIRPRSGESMGFAGMGLTYRQCKWEAGSGQADCTLILQDWY
ncbi:hypothetical protein NDU88_003071 [Pleurodeles waltl]|uniref:Uncharacterized protein n=1 Tax=Pleurodeles waltl TaxID=8319 RepID=A0AAV7T4G9_PLEWA|nr:hypothetical protein NDU88_003071 [Pleurodeles waltl]